MKHISRERGFTLIEISIVVAIIALITTVVIIASNNARARARDAQRLTDAGVIKIAISNYYARKGYYPSLPGNSYETNGGPGHSWAELEAELGTKLPKPPNPGPASFYEYYKSWGIGTAGAGNCFGKTILRIQSYETKPKVAECNEQYGGSNSTYLFP